MNLDYNEENKSFEKELPKEELPDAENLTEESE